jgi:hypothetical protein
MHDRRVLGRLARSQGKECGIPSVIDSEAYSGPANAGGVGGKSGHQTMWLWIGASPLWWLFGFPFGGAFFVLGLPSLSLSVAMIVVLLGMGLLARSALNY